MINNSEFDFSSFKQIGYGKRGRGKSAAIQNEAVISMRKNGHGRERNISTGCAVLQLPESITNSFIKMHGSNQCDVGFESRSRQFSITPGPSRTISVSNGRNKSKRGTVSLQSFTKEIINAYGEHTHIYFTCDEYSNGIVLTPTGKVD